MAGDTYVEELAAKNIAPWTKERVHEEIRSFRVAMTDILHSTVDFTKDKYAEHSEHPFFPVAIRIIEHVDFELEHFYENMERMLHENTRFPYFVKIEAAKEEAEELAEYEAHSFATLCISKMFEFPLEARASAGASEEVVNMAVSIWTRAADDAREKRLTDLIDDEDEIPGWMHEPDEDRIKANWFFKEHMKFQLSALLGEILQHFHWAISENDPYA